MLNLDCRCHYYNSEYESLLYQNEKYKITTSGYNNIPYKHILKLMQASICILNSLNDDITRSERWPKLSIEMPGSPATDSSFTSHLVHMRSTVLEILDKLSILKRDHDNL